jgi:hypothetical protein
LAGLSPEQRNVLLEQLSRMTGSWDFMLLPSTRRASSCIFVSLKQVFLLCN